MKFKYEKNPLTLKPGGDTLRLTFSDKKTQTQDRIKYANTYLETVKKAALAEGRVLIQAEIWKEDVDAWEQIYLDPAAWKHYMEDLDWPLPF